MHSTPAPVIVISGGAGVGKSTLALNLADALPGYGLRARNLSIGWWFRAFTALALSVFEQSGQLSDVAVAAADLPGIELARLARSLDLGITSEGKAVIGGATLRPATHEQMGQLAPHYGGNHYLRELMLEDVWAMLAANPGMTFAIDSRSGRRDFLNLGRQVVSLYLTATPEVAAERKGMTTEGLIARDLADRELPEGPLEDPVPTDWIIDTSEMSKHQVLHWALGVLRHEGII